MGGCLYSMGCKGPTTYNICSIVHSSPPWTHTTAPGLEAGWVAVKMRYFMDKLMVNPKAGDSFMVSVGNWYSQAW
jgi:Ni,Fe-hydrogenase I small subunit